MADKQLVPGTAPRVPAQPNRPAPPAEAAHAMVLEFESPTAALIAQRIPVSARYTTWVLVTLFAALFAVAATVPIDRVVTTTGKVVTTAANVVLQPLETSIVKSIDVREGQLVHAGQLLARLDPTFAQADAGALEQQVSSLQAEVNRLTAEQQGRDYLSDGSATGQLQAMIFTQRHAERAYRLENYRQKIDSLQVKVNQAKSDIESFNQRLTNAKTVEAMRKDLERLQVGSKLNTLAAVDTRLEIERGLETARATAQTAQRDLDAMIAERNGYVQQQQGEISQALTDQGRKLSDAKENLHKATLRRALVELRADKESIVLSVAPISVGSVMQSGDQFITLVPVDAPLEVETIVDGRDSGYVQVGDPVTIKFDTFPYTTHGTADGRVMVVSPDSFRNPNQDRAGLSRPRGGGNSEDFGQLYYRTRISLDAIRLHDLPPGFRLAPGMPVTADIKIGRRTLLRYIMQRAIPEVTEGMREP